ncbi:MAG: di-trans,poly-cis-decaprenylcistransferase [Candidatus Hydrogenedentota bacterium]|nr:MAG: di-trans,poly-cis-decaprenylcistransferase [Candidatus Hydrogenedentota bacterium]
MALTEQGQIPKHVAVIMDGNGRWAKKRNLPRSEGHKQGALVLESLFEECIRQNIKVVSLYAFSTENWKRPKSEIKTLFSLLDTFITEKLDTMVKLGVKLFISGDISKLPKRSQKKIETALAKTKKGKKLIANFCINYGSRDEIKRAALLILQSRLQKIKSLSELEKVQKRKISEKEFSAKLYTKTLPDVDLLIRTAGEKRLSNFMLYQAAYAELYFTETLWPDFNKKELQAAIRFYQSRVRKFGGLPDSEQ